MFVVCTFHQFTKFRCWILTCHKLMRDIARQPSLTRSPPAGINGMVAECDCFLLMGCKIHVRMRRCLYAYWAKMRVCTYRSNCRTHSDIYIISFISILCYLTLFDVDVPWLCVALSENRWSQDPPSHCRSAGFSAGRTSATCCISSKRAASCLGGSSVTGLLDLFLLVSRALILFLPRCLCRPDVSTMIRSYFSFLKSSTPASVGRPCWVGSLLPFRLRLPAFLRNLHWIRLIVVAIERYSHLDESTGNIPRHPKATEGYITTQGYLYMSREEPCPMCWLKLRIILSSCCHHLVSHIILSYGYGSKPIAKPWYHGEHQNINR